MIAKIYVACLKAYNNGKLHGRWIDANQSADDIQDEVNEMLYISPENTDDDPCEEHAIHDYQGFGSIKLGECEDFETVATLAELIDEHGELIAEFYSYNICNLDDLCDKFQEAYLGEYESLEDYAYHFVEDTGMLSEIPDSIARYFDYDSFANDLKLGGDIFEIRFNGACHVFDNNV